MGWQRSEVVVGEGGQLKKRKLSVRAWGGFIMMRHGDIHYLIWVVIERGVRAPTYIC